MNQDIDKAVIFQVGAGEYSISIKHVISIEKEENITNIAQLPSYVLGITKVRDELIPVIDLQNVLYSKSIASNEHNRLIVIRTEELSFAVLVHAAKEIIDVKDEMIKQAGLSAYNKTSYFTGVLNLEDNRLVMMIEPKVLIDSLEGIKEIKDYMNRQPA